MRDSTAKHVRGYELSRKVENCKGYMYGWLRKTNTERNAHSYHSPC